MQLVVVMMDRNAAVSLRANLDAWQLFPFPAHTRAQMALTFHRLMDWKRDKLEVDPATAALLYRISLSAGASATATLASRLDYLVNYTNPEQSSGEIEAILTVMRGNAARFAGTWLHEGWQAYRVGDYARVAVAIERGRRMADIYLKGKSGRNIIDQIDALEKKVSR